MKKRWLPKWVSEYRSRHGKSYYRFRRKGFTNHTFKNDPGTEEFMEEYQACLDGDHNRLVPQAHKATPGSVDDLLARYYRSAEFVALRSTTQAVYRREFDRWRRQYGGASVRDLESHHVAEMLAERLPHVHSANTLRKRLSFLMDFAIRLGFADKNPVRAIRSYKTKSTGYHTWTDEEIARFEAFHPTGTIPRLAFDLLLWTGQRGGDVRILGPQHIKDKRINIVQSKTGAKVSLPILAPLAESILATPTRGLVFILSAHNKPYSAKSFPQRFSKWCTDAGLPHCTAHGLRKAAARRLAEAGCTNQQIKSWTGHTTDSEVARYTAAADQLTLSDAAGLILMANLETKLAKDSDKPLGKGA